MNKYLLVVGINYGLQNWRVPGIKIIRIITGFGLKEAKDIHDSIGTGTITFCLNAEQVAKFALERESIPEFPLVVHSLTRLEVPTYIDVSNNN